jgi:type II secretory ATPase GspE/PulE/Tfp pilus assembly ATPase PilB-like protein
MTAASNSYPEVAREIIRLVGGKVDHAQGENHLQVLSRLGINEANVINLLARRFKAPFFPCTSAVPTGTVRAIVRHMQKYYHMAPSSDLPWLPVANVGSILVLGHFYPNFRDTLGLPEGTFFKVTIGFEDYRKYQQICLELLGDGGAQAQFPMPPAAAFGNPLQLLEWLVRNHYLYDFDEHDNRSIEELEKLMAGKEDLLCGIIALGRNSPMVPIRAISVDEEAQKTIPEVMLEKYQAVCYARLANTYYMLLPSLSQAGKFLDELNARTLDSDNTFKQVIACAVTEPMIRLILDQSKGKAAVKVADDEDNERKEEVFSIDANAIAKIRELDGNNARQILSYAFYRATVSRASDLHIDMFNNKMRLRLRVDGSLVDLAMLPYNIYSAVVSLIKVQADLDVAEHRLPQDGTFTVKVGERKVEIRVSVIPSGEFESVALRLLDKSVTIKTMADLTLPTEQELIIKQAISHSYGLILVTGPTGCGKTSTLAAMLNTVNTPDVNVITLEDPPEIEINGAKQIAVNSKIELTFGRLLRHVLRHDPDIVMVGEIRDEETAEQAIRAALTGHLVLSTLHTNDAIASVGRLRNMGIQSSYIADCLILLQAQRLIRQLCDCKLIRPSTEREKKIIAHYMPDNCSLNKPLRTIMDEFLKGEGMVFGHNGCHNCQNTGYTGRRAIMELCPVSLEIKDLIAREVPGTEIYRAAQRSGYHPLFSEALRQVISGRTDFDEVMSHNAELDLELT